MLSYSVIELQSFQLIKADRQIMLSTCKIPYHPTVSAAACNFCYTLLKSLWTITFYSIIYLLSLSLLQAVDPSGEGSATRVLFIYYVSYQNAI